MIRRRGTKWQIGVHTEAASESRDSHRQLQESPQRAGHWLRHFIRQVNGSVNFFFFFFYKIRALRKWRSEQIRHVSALCERGHRFTRTIFLYALTTQRLSFVSALNKYFRGFTALALLLFSCFPLPPFSVLFPTWKRLSICPLLITGPPPLFLLFLLLKGNWICPVNSGGLSTAAQL